MGARITWAHALVAALAGRWHGGYGIARCPAHDDRSPSLAVRDGEDGRLLVRCHAGCHQAAVIAALRGRGLWPGRGPDPFVPIGTTVAAPFSKKGQRRRPPSEALTQSHDAGRARSGEAALGLWRQCRPAAETRVAFYLGNRGITLSPPTSIRFHPRLKHSPSGQRLPAMVAAVQGADGKIVGVHRTFLRPDGGGKADVDPQRMMLGCCAGGAVRLAPVAAELHVAEGIETAIAAMQATGVPTWAALSTSGVAALVLPETVRQVLILADGDDPGERAAQAAAQRWCRAGLRVRIARPPAGSDFNDVLVATPA